MKKLILINLFPFTIVLFFIYYLAFNTKFNSFLFPLNTNESQEYSDNNYIANFADNPSSEKDFLLAADSNASTIYLLGSSELTSESEAIPYKFISNNFAAKIKAIGHAGNQSFSIYCQLLANKERLDNTKIIFIISPGWFESKSAMGTSSEIFLEYNSEAFLKKILYQNDSFSSYAGKRMAQLYSEFNAPNLPLKIINFKYRASVSPLHKIIFTPLIYIDLFLLKKKEALLNTVKKSARICSKVSAQGTLKNNTINWDSLFYANRLQVINKATNNNIGVNDDYYTKHLHKKTGKMYAVTKNNNQELEDFKMLMQLIRSKNIDAFFIIQPLNPLYYKNLADISPAINEVRNELKGNKNQKSFNYADFFVTDTAHYDRGLLDDIMHFSDYGWYKVNQSIIKHYNLNHEK